MYCAELSSLVTPQFHRRPAAGFSKSSIQCSFRLLIRVFLSWSWFGDNDRMFPMHICSKLHPLEYQAHSPWNKQHQCRICHRPSSRWITRPSKRNGNAGRPYYKWWSCSQGNVCSMALQEVKSQYCTMSSRNQKALLLLCRMNVEYYNLPNSNVFWRSNPIHYALTSPMG